MFRLSSPTYPTSQDGSNSSNELDLATTCRQQAGFRSSKQQLKHHHPNVKVPPRLEEKPIKEQIQRCCDRIQYYPKAVDTLIRALSTILGHPRESKFRHIDKTNIGYQKCLANVPGVESMLYAIGFVPLNTETLVLSRTSDLDVFLLALSMLEQTTVTSSAYQQAKKEQIFIKEVNTLLQANNNNHISEKEQNHRQHLLSKLPKEPKPGCGAVIMIQFPHATSIKKSNTSVSENATTSTTITRRFDSDDTLEDVLNWIGGTVGTIFLDNICNNNGSEWCLVDVNKKEQLDCHSSEIKSKTLHYLGFWPSGRLALRMSPASSSLKNK